MTSRSVPIRSLLIRDRWSGQLVTGIALAWFLIGGSAILGALFIGYDAPAGSNLPGPRAFGYLSVFSVIAAVAAWLRFRIVYRTFVSGTMADGVLVKVHASGGSAKLTFEYTHEETRKQIVNYVLGGPLRKTGDPVQVVYDPQNPKRAFVWDAYVPSSS